jgi:neutral ceramidase
MPPLPRWLLFVVLTLPGLEVPAVASEPLQVGVAEADITPPKGFLMAGYYHERRATGTIGPLKAKAMVFRAGKEQAALVVCDLTGIAVDLSSEVRRRASAKTGIPVGRMVVSATHSHTAPDYTRDLYEHLGGKTAPPDQPRYAVKLIDGIVEAITKANVAAKPVILEAGSARQETPVSFNRRFVMTVA